MTQHSDKLGPVIENARSEWTNKMRAGKRVLCGICNDPILFLPRGQRYPGWEKLKLSIDHIIPKKLGGLDVRENLQPSHAKCNARKGHKDLRNQLMSKRICLLKDVRVLVASRGYSAVYLCDATGNEQGEPLSEANSDKTYRVYRCDNCGKRENAAGDEFSMKQHLGRMHPLIDPFN